MAKAQARISNSELVQDITDGTYKQVVKDPGGVVEGGAWEQRKLLSTAVYGIVEKAEKICPDMVGAVPARTPWTRPSPVSWSVTRRSEF